MKTGNAVRHKCDAAGVGTVEVSGDIMRGRSFMGSILNRRSIPQADTFAEIAEACDYELQLVGHGVIIQIDA